LGLMARYGSEKIRGHGIPEAIEAILFGKSRMSPKVAILRPLSSGNVIGSNLELGRAPHGGAARLCACGCVARRNLPAHCAPAYIDCARVSRCAVRRAVPDPLAA
jgi:hypothetical protein